ncbi:class I SAM-dependent methyltransferase [Nocardiopsis trehalosi]|uniref:class I SAM-dependent methyltransferase n=1 Tax=Nocardiopsis trehalosi TaxID=109329 RepID=UPI00082AC509|nr:class I SAM-dependent methyltransferase [Nocardiopsis trehalosi]
MTTESRPAPAGDPPAGTAPAVAALLRHRWIASAEAGADGRVYVRPDPAALAPTAAPGSLTAEFLDHWGELYDWTYTSAAQRHSDDLDLSGWRASDTGLPLPADHMAQWADRTVDLVLEGRPDLVLELGCGTGLLTHRLRGRVAGYVGTDVAPHAVETLSAGAPPGTAFVRAAAHEAQGAEVRAALERVGGAGARPDRVVLNSVTQCFPDLAYLEAVVLGAVALVRPGGAVVVGDVRHAALLDAYCRWVERAAAPGADSAEIVRRAAERARRDDELLVDPAALAAVAARSPRAVRVSFRAKTMAADTELTRYRFDAVLTVDAPAPEREPRNLDWTELDAGAPLETALGRLLDGPGPVRVGGFPNAALSPAPGAVTGARLRAAVAGRDACVELDAADPGLLAVCAPAAASARPAAEAAGPGRAHEPLRAFVERRLAEAARSHLRRELPPGSALPPVVVLGADGPR